MSSELADIQRDLGELTGIVKAGFEGVHKRQDTTNGRIYKLEEAQAALAMQGVKDRADIDNLKGGSADQKQFISRWTDKALSAAFGIIGAGIALLLVRAGIVDPELFK